MRKYIYIFFLTALVLAFQACLKSGTQVAGPIGATGATGVPGGDLPGGFAIPFTLSTNDMGNVASPTLNYSKYIFTGYDSATTYLLNVYVNRQKTKEWYKLPMYNYATPGDELYASLGHDTIKIFYLNPSSSGWPADSQMNANIVVIPHIQQP